MLSRESVHKVKATNSIFHFGVHFIENAPTIVIAEFIGENSRLITMATILPLLPFMFKFAKGRDTFLSVEGIMPSRYSSIFSIKTKTSICPK